MPLSRNSVSTQDGVPVSASNPLAVSSTDFYQTAQEGRWSGYSVFTKFGRNPSTGTGAEDIWNGGGDYTGQPAGAAPELVTVVSSSTDDASAGTGARTVSISGLKTSTSTAYESETITLNGTTPVDSVNSWYRVNRLRVLTAGSGGANAGTLTVAYKITTANVFAAIPIGYNQTQVAAWTVPAGSTAWLKRVRIAIARSGGQTGSAEITIRARTVGGVYRAIRVYEVTTSSPVQYEALGGEEFPAGTDIKVRAESTSNAGTIVEAALEMVIVED